VVVVVRKKADSKMVSKEWLGAKDQAELLLFGFALFLRQGLAMQPRLASNSGFRPVSVS
jgi:hypothetical protein